RGTVGRLRRSIGLNSLSPGALDRCAKQWRELFASQPQCFVVRTGGFVLGLPDVIFFSCLEVGVSEKSLHGQHIVVGAAQMDVSGRRPKAVCCEADTNMTFGKVSDL